MDAKPWPEWAADSGIHCFYCRAVLLAGESVTTMAVGRAHSPFFAHPACRPAARAVA